MTHGHKRQCCKRCTTLSGRQLALNAVYRACLQPCSHTLRSHSLQVTGAKVALPPSTPDSRSQVSCCRSTCCNGCAASTLQQINNLDLVMLMGLQGGDYDQCNRGGSRVMRMCRLGAARPRSVDTLAVPDACRHAQKGQKWGRTSTG